MTAGSTTSGIDAALQPTVGQISGKVTNASTLAAVEGVEVCALTSADVDRGCTSTDSAGMYTLTGLAVGEYRVVFIAPEAANFAPQYYEGKAKFAEATAVSVIADSTTTGIDAALTAGGQITGTVTDAVTKAPLANAEVCANNQSLEFEFFAFFSRCTDTNSAGQYTFTGLAGGEYKVSFIGPSGYASQNYNDKSELSEADPVHVTAGSATTGIDAALQPTAACSASPAIETGPSAQAVTAPTAATFKVKEGTIPANCSAAAIQWEVSSERTARAGAKVSSHKRPRATTANASDQPHARRANRAMNSARRSPTDTGTTDSAARRS